MSLTRIKVIVADDHHIARQGIISLISDTAEIEVIGEASNGEMAIGLVENLKPDILISDISMAGLSGIELSEVISDRFPATKVLILSMHKDQEYIQKSFESGAMGYLPKNSDEKELREAILQIHDGNKYITTEVSIILAQSMITQKPQEKFNLTSREQEVLNMLVEGMSNKQIAADLFLSIRTVDTHRTNIMKKLEVKNIAELVKKALSKKLVGNTMKSKK